MTAVTRELTPQDPDAVAQVRARGLAADRATTLSGTLSLLSEPTRLRILYALDQVGPMCVGDLALALDVGEDAVSYALRLLRTAGLVSSRKHGRSVLYRLAADFPEPLLNHCWLRLVDLSAIAGEAS
jgi:ArsR family transcriptional regulator, lead/cadmium/zinc/bismuth-responsive transcriptional repressor